MWIELLIIIDYVKLIFVFLFIEIKKETINVITKVFKVKSIIDTR